MIQRSLLLAFRCFFLGLDHTMQSHTNWLGIDVVGENRNRLGGFAQRRAGIVGDRDLPFLLRWNDLRAFGRRAAAGGLHLLDPQGVGADVLELEHMLHSTPLRRSAEVKAGLLKLYLGTLGFRFLLYAVCTILSKCKSERHRKHKHKNAVKNT